jgi:RES domain-containing protein
VRLWRLSRHASLDGSGGLTVSGRWHTRGQPVLYCATHPAAAVLEQLVHQEIRRPEALQGYRMLQIELPDDVQADRIEYANLSNRWRNDIGLTRRIGDEWLTDGNTAVLHVPSAVVTATYNIVINPRHADARRLRVLDDQPFVFDPRLLSS